MVIRVLAGAVPMLTGALIFSGVIPVGKLIYGDAGANPAAMIRTLSDAEGFARDSGFDEQMSVAPLSPQQRAAMTPEQRAAYQQRRERARVNAIRTEAARDGTGADRAGWAPKSGGWGR